MVSVIILEDVPVVYSPMSLVEPVRGAVSSTQQQQNIAAPHYGNLSCALPRYCASCPLAKKSD